MFHLSIMAVRYKRRKVREGEEAAALLVRALERRKELLRERKEQMQERAIKEFAKTSVSKRENFFSGFGDSMKVAHSTGMGGKENNQKK
jgi:hypothetical protein